MIGVGLGATRDDNLPIRLNRNSLTPVPVATAEIEVVCCLAVYAKTGIKRSVGQKPEYCKVVVRSVVLCETRDDDPAVPLDRDRPPLVRHVSRRQVKAVTCFAVRGETRIERSRCQGRQR